MENKNCTIVIPARMGSTRLPNKPLKELAGKPLLQWVIELAQNVNFKATLIVVTEDKIIKDFVESFGVECFLTNKIHKNGTARIIEILDHIDSEYIINLQGDEPLVNPNHIDYVALNISKNLGLEFFKLLSLKRSLLA